MHETTDIAPHRSARERGLRDRFLVVAFTALLVVNLLPLTARYLPFTDLQSHMGLVGALLHFDNPAARGHALFTLNPRHFLPSLMFENTGELLGSLLSVPVFANLYIALGCIIGPTVGLAYLLSAYRRDPRLSLLLFPVVYYRCLWFGFVDYTSSVPFVLFGLGLLRRTLDAPSRWRLCGLGLLGLVIVETHFFGASVFFFLYVVVLISERPRPPGGLTLRLLVALIPGVLFLGRWLLGIGTRVGRSGTLPAVLHADRNPIHLALRFYEWTIHGIQTPCTHLVMAALALSMIAVGIWAWIGRQRRQAASGSRQPLVLLVAAICLFVLLPFKIPIWWAINIRLVPLVVAFTILSLGPEGRRVPGWLLVPGIVAGIFWGGYLARDFRTYYNGRELDGFEAALADIPPGQRVLSLWPESELHYTHFPMHTLGNQYMVRRGGLNWPMLDGEPENYPIRPRPAPPAPNWGRAALFSYRAFGGWDYYLVKHPIEGTLPREPFAGVLPQQVTLVSTHGLWQVWRNQALPHAGAHP